jgi:hypothetical protein
MKQWTATNLLLDFIEVCILDVRDCELGQSAYAHETNADCAGLDVIRFEGGRVVRRPYTRAQAVHANTLHCTHSLVECSTRIYNTLVCSCKTGG